jgi:hypothetical protein
MTIKCDSRFSAGCKPSDCYRPETEHKRTKQSENYFVIRNRLIPIYLISTDRFNIVSTGCAGHWNFLYQFMTLF